MKTSTVFKFPGPGTRFSYKTWKQYKLPKLTELQIAALACVRNGEITKYEKRVGYERFVAWKSNGFDITCQIHALKKRKLIRSSYKRDGLFILTPWGEQALEQHPEF